MKNLEYMCFKCFTVHKGQICPKCNATQTKTRSKKQRRKQPKKTYEFVLANRDEYGDADEIFIFKLDELQEAQKCWVQDECNSIEINVWFDCDVDRIDLNESPKYIQKIAKQIMQ